jgi:hypothetical protein
MNLSLGAVVFPLVKKTHLCIRVQWGHLNILLSLSSICHLLSTTLDSFSPSLLIFIGKLSNTYFGFVDGSSDMGTTEVALLEIRRGDYGAPTTNWSLGLA